MIDHDKILADRCLQMRDRLVEPHPVEPGLLCVGKQPFQVLECTGHFGLAMTLDHRHVDQKIDLVHIIDDIQLHSGAVHSMPFLLLAIHKRDAILLAQFFITAVFIGFGSAVSHPGTLDNCYVGKLLLLQKLDYPRDNFRVCRSSELCRRWNHQVGLDADPCLSVSDQGIQPGFLKQLFRHSLIVRSI